MKGCVHYISKKKNNQKERNKLKKYTINSKTKISQNK